MSEIVLPPLSHLLERELLAPDTRAAEEWLAARRVLITGAAGSIGSALSRRLARLAPPGLVLLDHHENSLFQLSQRLREGMPEDQPAPTPVLVLADVCDPERIGAVLRRHRPEVVFHLAAYKHVPLGEAQPAAYVANNVLGTWQLLAAAKETGVETLIYPSTDKAVAPVNSYGATKRIVERMLRALAAEDGAPRLVAARLVNVLGARGGVIEKFARQIGEGRPLTVTDPGMTRYWITEREALDYLILAAAQGPSGGVLTLDLGRPVRVVEVARRLWELLGPAGEPFAPRYIGAYPGERLDEFLVGPDEEARPSGIPQVLAVRERVASGETPAEIARLVTELAALVAADDAAGLRARLGVPFGAPARG
ncbi:MAG TPA: polysaccharide biosynthesis protein [Thermomicrobiaceae bacterium]|nr:polysaccharide biosynthesis protein [Thermomicrobiaceae bacterium]